MDNFQLAKRIATRLLSSAEAKKPSNGPVAGACGFDSFDRSYGYPGQSKKIEMPNGRVGVIIGKGGETIKYLQLQSGAKIQVTRDMDADPNSPNTSVELMGTPDQIAKAEQLINDVLAEADGGGSGLVSRRLPGQQSGGEQFSLKVPKYKAGLVIGKGGETIKNMQARTGARIQMPKNKSKKPKAVEHENSTSSSSSTKPNKPGNEIDEIFAGKKRKKPENQEKSTVTKPQKVKKKISSKPQNDDVLSEPTCRQRKKTTDGFTIYTEEELGFGRANAGGTPLCPFDCDCCF